MRLASKKAATREWAERAFIFTEDRQPNMNYLAIPKTSFERRMSMPIGWLTESCIASTENFTIPDATLYHFGVLQSAMHMAWMRRMAGRPKKATIAYPATIVYNTFPWPAPSDKQHAAIESAAQSVLDGRACFPDATLADLYDPLTMPSVLLAAHQTLDRAMDAAYPIPGSKLFAAEARRWPSSLSNISILLINHKRHGGRISARRSRQSIDPGSDTR